MDTGVVEGGLNVTLTIRLLMHGKVSFVLVTIAAPIPLECVVSPRTSSTVSCVSSD